MRSHGPSLSLRLHDTPAVPTVDAQLISSRILSVCDLQVLEASWGKRVSGGPLCFSDSSVSSRSPLKPLSWREESPEILSGRSSGDLCGKAQEGH